MTNYQSTNRKFYEISDVNDNGLTPDESAWGLMYVDSDENLCDNQSDGTCVGKRYYTDTAWAITHWCQKHFDELVRDGTFVEIRTNYSAVSKIHRKDYVDAPFGVETLIEVSDLDASQGSSEMAWFKTESAQNKYYQQQLTELKNAGIALTEGK